MSILDQIIASTRTRLDQESEAVPALRLQANEARRSRREHQLSQALRNQEGPAIIAEIKAASPSAGDILPNPDVSAIAAGYARAGAAAISVVTEREYFKGSPTWLDLARQASGLPVLMKDFVIDERQIFRAAIDGADAVLLLASILETDRMRSFIQVIESVGMDALVEVHDEREMAVAVDAGASMIGINNRNLKDFSVSLSIGERLVSSIPAGVVRVAESGIRSRADIDRLGAAGFDAFLIGTSLLSSGDPERRLLELTEVRVG